MRSRSTQLTSESLINVVGIACIVWLAIPLAIAMLMAIITPTYFEPMFTSVVGWLMLAVGATIVGGGAVLSLLAVNWMKRGGGFMAAGIVVVIVIFLAQFFTLWIVLLGPALLILLRPANS